MLWTSLRSYQMDFTNMMIDRDNTFFSGTIVAILSALIITSFVMISRSFWAPERPAPVVASGESVPNIAERFPKGDALLPPSSPPSQAIQAQTDTLIPSDISAGIIDKDMKTKKIVEAEDLPEDNGYEKRRDVCSRNGGHRINFRRHHHIMWRCVYPRRGR